MEIASLVINFCINLYILLSKNYPEDLRTIFSIVLFSFWLISLIGTIAYYTTRKKAFGITAMIGFGFFVPIGLIGLIGIRKTMDNNDREKFQKEVLNGKS